MVLLTTGLRPFQRHIIAMLFEPLLMSSTKGWSTEGKHQRLCAKIFDHRQQMRVNDEGDSADTRSETDCFSR